MRSLNIVAWLLVLCVVLMLNIALLYPAAGFAQSLSGDTSGTIASECGVKGEATANTGTARGVWGTTDSKGSGAGVYGKATSRVKGSKARGVVGITNSRKGIGVLGVANRRRGKKYGVKGITRSNTTGTAGVYGLATNTTGINYGIYGKTRSSDGYAGYFDGNLRLVPQSDGRSTPSEGDMYYDDEDNELKIYNGSAWNTVSSITENVYAVTDATSCTNIEGTGLSISTGTLNVGGLTDSELSSGDFNNITGIGTQAQELNLGGYDITNAGEYKIGSDTVLQASGTDNIFVGKDAGASITTGTSNTAIGSGALDAVTTEGNCTAIGYGALGANTDANNTAVGYNALGSNTTGTEVTAVGSGALDANTTGDRNTAFGYNALGANNTGSDNVAFGHSALLLNEGAGNYNTAVGNYALDANTTGNNNTAIGYDALGANDTGYDNVAVGYQAGNANTTGDTNTFIGYRAGNSNTTASANTFIGYRAGNANTTGIRNAFMGYWAGYSNTEGYENTFIGLMAGQDNTTGYYNTFLGYRTGDSNTTGDYNTSLGYRAGNSNSTGDGNVFLGYRAGYSETGSNKLYIDNSNTTSPLIYGDFSTDTLTINGGLIQTVVTISANDTTPDVSGGNIFVTSANTGATAISDLDDPQVGQIVYIIGGSNTNASTIADSGNFHLSAAWTANEDDVLVLFVKADNDYIELSRVDS